MMNRVFTSAFLVARWLIVEAVIVPADDRPEVRQEPLLMGDSGISERVKCVFTGSSTEGETQMGEADAGRGAVGRQKRRLPDLLQQGLHDHPFGLVTRDADRAAAGGLDQGTARPVVSSLGSGTEERGHAVDDPWRR